MTKRADPDVCGAFYQKYADQLEECIRNRTGADAIQNCKDLAQAARKELGYSRSTSTVDILSPLRRGYKLWRSGQMKGAPAVDQDPSVQ